MDDGRKNFEFCSMITVAAVIAVIAGIVLSGYLLFFTEKEYSALYLVPDSYSNLARNDTIAFTYGIFCSEGKATVYDIAIYHNGTLVRTEQVLLDTNENYEKNEEIRLTGNVPSPAKIEVVLTNMNTMDTEDVHFWVEQGA